MVKRKSLLEAMVELGKLGSIAKSDEGFGPETPEAQRVVFGTIKPGGLASNLDTFGFGVHTKGSVAGGEAIPAEGITQAVHAGALKGELRRVLGEGWEADQGEDANAARYCLGSTKKSNLWNDDLNRLAQAPAEPAPKPPATPPQPKPTPTPAPVPPAPQDAFRAGVEAVCLDLEGTLPKLPPQGGIPAQAVRRNARALRAILGPAKSAGS